MHYLLSEASLVSPVQGNAGGSYLTLRSLNGLIFGVINLIGNFATVFQDQAYWQRAIASRPSTTVKAYLIGGLAWSVFASLSAYTSDTDSWLGLLFRLHSRQLSVLLQ